MKSKNMHGQSGLTLIELSIVMVISGILLAGAIRAYTIYEVRVKAERMNVLMTTLDQTIAAYYAAEGRFPCPAPVDSASAGNNYDSESCAAGSALNVAGTGGGRVLIGKIPAATLGLSNEYMRDIYGSYLTYAVTETSTVNGGSIQGRIEVKDEDIDRVAGSPTFGQVVELEAHTNITYLVLSSGPTRVGAFMHNGAQAIACSGTSKDRENCDNDSVFVSSLTSDGGTTDSASYYDDRIVFKKDDDVNSASPTSLKIAREGRDFDRISTSMGDEIHMKKDGYLVNNFTQSSGSPNGANGGDNPQNGQMIALKSGDVLASGVAGYSVGGAVAIALNGTNIVTGGGRQASTFSQGGREVPSGEYVFSNEYGSNGSNISKVPTITRSYSCSSCGGGNQGDGYDYSGSYAGYIWVE